MSKLDEDILYLILKELQKNDRKSLYSCLMVNRSWCKTTVPILWTNPRPTDSAKFVILFNVILLHLSEESREILKKKEIVLLTESSQRPLFDYISFWRHLNLYVLESMITSITSVYSEKSIIRNEILKLLINKNTKFTHIHINVPLFNYNSYQLHLIPGAEHCFSELRFLKYDASNNNQNVLEGLAKISKSVKKLEFHDRLSNITGIVKLIEAQKNLNDVRIHPLYMTLESSIHKTLEESLIKHANTVQHLQIYWKPVTKIFSHFINLVSLDINIPYSRKILKVLDWDNVKHISLPSLKILKAQGIPSNGLTSLIESTKGSLTEISIDYGYDDYKSIQAIYQNCPNLRYIKLCLENKSISELEKLLINCRYLSGLVISTYTNHILYENFDWNNLFKVLIKSSPESLFKFKFWVKSYWIPRLESLNYFFQGWKGRHPMLLQTVPDDRLTLTSEYYGLIVKYEREGTIKKWYNDLWREDFDDFEWIQKNNLIG